MSSVFALPIGFFQSSGSSPLGTSPLLPLLVYSPLPLHPLSLAVPHRLRTETFQGVLSFGIYDPRFPPSLRVFNNFSLLFFFHLCLLSNSLILGLYIRIFISRPMRGHPPHSLPSLRRLRMFFQFSFGIFSPLPNALLSIRSTLEPIVPSR